MEKRSLLGQKHDVFPFFIYKTTHLERIEKHKHDFWELIYIYSGQGECHLGDDVFQFKAHQLILTPPDISHAFYSPVGKNHQQISLTIYPEKLAELAIAGVNVNTFLNNIWESKKAFVSLSEADAEKIEMNIENILNEYHFQAENFESLIALEITRLLILWERFEANVSSVFLRFKNLPSILLAALEAIETDYGKISGLEEILKSANAHLNERYFTRLFKKHVGMTPIQYLNRVKIEKAALLLLTKNQSISYIAMDAGFGDLRFFNRLFKRFVAMTPSQFKQQAVHNPELLKRADRFVE